MFTRKTIKRVGKKIDSGVSGVNQILDSFDFIAAVMAEAVLFADLTTAAFAALPKLSTARRAIQMVGTLRRAALGTDGHASLIDFINNQANYIGE